MSLTLEQGKKMLRQIVGGTGYSSNFQTRYLGLSSTKPTNEPSTPGGTNYNVTEPSRTETSYRRVQLQSGNQNLYFHNEATGAVDPETEEYVITIKNDTEIHFPECTDEEGWGNYKYFVLFENDTSTVPVYFGKLIYDEEQYPQGLPITKGTVPLVRREQLVISVK